MINFVSPSYFLSRQYNNNNKMFKINLSGTKSKENFKTITKKDSNDVQYPKLNINILNDNNNPIHDANIDPKLIKENHPLKKQNDPFPSSTIHSHNKHLLEASNLAKTNPDEGENLKDYNLKPSGSVTFEMSIPSYMLNNILTIISIVIGASLTIHLSCNIKKNFELFFLNPRDLLNEDDENFIHAIHKIISLPISFLSTLLILYETFSHGNFLNGTGNYKDRQSVFAVLANKMNLSSYTSVCIVKLGVIMILLSDSPFDVKIFDQLILEDILKRENVLLTYIIVHCGLSMYNVIIRFFFSDYYTIDSPSIDFIQKRKDQNESEPQLNKSLKIYLNIINIISPIFVIIYIILLAIFYEESISFLFVFNHFLIAAFTVTSLITMWIIIYKDDYRYYFTTLYLNITSLSSINFSLISIKEEFESVFLLKCLLMLFNVIFMVLIVIGLFMIIKNKNKKIGEKFYSEKFNIKILVFMGSLLLTLSIGHVLYFLVGDINEMDPEIYTDWKIKSLSGIYKEALSMIGESGLQSWLKYVLMVYTIPICIICVNFLDFMIGIRKLVIARLQLFHLLIISLTLSLTLKIIYKSYDNMLHTPIEWEGISTNYVESPELLLCIKAVDLLFIAILILIIHLCLSEFNHNESTDFIHNRPVTKQKPQSNESNITSNNGDSNKDENSDFCNFSRILTTIMPLLMALGSFVLIIYLLTFNWFYIEHDTLPDYHGENNTDPLPEGFELKNNSDLKILAENLSDAISLISEYRPAPEDINPVGETIVRFGFMILPFTLSIFIMIWGIFSTCSKRLFSQSKIIMLIGFPSICISLFFHMTLIPIAEVNAETTPFIINIYTINTDYTYSLFYIHIFLFFGIMFMFSFTIFPVNLPKLPNKEQEEEELKKIQNKEEDIDINGEKDEEPEDAYY